MIVIRFKFKVPMLPKKTSPTFPLLSLGSIPEGKEITALNITRGDTSNRPLKRASLSGAIVITAAAESRMKRVKSEDSFFAFAEEGRKIGEEKKLSKQLKNDVWDVFLIPNMSPCSSPVSSPILRRRVRISEEDLNKASTEARASAELAKELAQTKASLLRENPNMDSESLDRAMTTAKGRLVRQPRFSQADTELGAKPEKKDSPRTINRKTVQNILGNILHQEEIFKNSMSLKARQQAQENLSLLLVVLIKEIRNSSFSDKQQLFQFIKAYNQTIISTLDNCSMKFKVEEATPNFYLLLITDYVVHHAQVFKYIIDCKVGTRPSVSFAGEHLKTDWTYLVEKGWPFEDKKGLDASNKNVFLVTC